MPTSDNDLGHWVTDLKIPDHFLGFVYKITDLTGPEEKYYIGKKLAKTMKKYPPLKGKTRNRRIEKDTDWKTYTGSSDALNARIKEYGKENFKFEIIRFCHSKSELAYFETKQIILEDALLKENYYNGILACKIKHFKLKDV